MIHNCFTYHQWPFVICNQPKFIHLASSLYIINDSNSDIVRVFWILPRHSTIPIIPAVLEKESAENIYEALLQRHPVGFWSFWALIEGGHLCCYIRVLLAPTINHIILIKSIILFIVYVCGARHCVTLFESWTYFFFKHTTVQSCASRLLFESHLPGKQKKGFNVSSDSLTVFQSSTYTLWFTICVFFELMLYSFTIEF